MRRERRRRKKLEQKKKRKKVDQQKIKRKEKTVERKENRHIVSTLSSPLKDVMCLTGWPTKTLTKKIRIMFKT